MRDSSAFLRRDASITILTWALYPGVEHIVTGFHALSNVEF